MIFSINQENSAAMTFWHSCIGDKTISNMRQRE